MLTLIRKNPARKWTFAPGRRRHSITVPILLVALILLGLAPAQAGTTTGFTPTDCSKKYIFVGLRGSGETHHGKLPATAAQKTLGDTLDRLYELLKVDPKFVNKIDYTTFLDYSADSVALSPEYFSQVVLKGPSRIPPDFMNLAKNCSNSYFLFAGYSQGAYLLHDLLYTFYDHPKNDVQTGISRRIVGAVLLADPGQTNSGVLPVLKSFAVANSQLPLASAFLFKAYAMTPVGYYLYGNQLYSFVDNLGYILTESKIWKIAGTLQSIPVLSPYSSGDVVADVSSATGWLSQVEKISSSPCFDTSSCMRTKLMAVAATYFAFNNAKKIHEGYWNDDGTWINQSLTLYKSHIF